MQIFLLRKSSDFPFLVVAATGSIFSVPFSVYHQKLFPINPKDPTTVIVVGVYSISHIFSATVEMAEAGNCLSSSSARLEEMQTLNGGGEVEVKVDNIVFEGANNKKPAKTARFAHLAHKALRRKNSDLEEDIEEAEDEVVNGKKSNKQKKKKKKRSK